MRFGLGLLVVVMAGCGAARGTGASVAATPAAEAPVAQAEAMDVAAPVASGAGAEAKRKASEDADAPSKSAPVAAERRMPAAGQLTAGVWDDNRNYDFWRPYALGFASRGGQDFAMFSDAEMESARDRANAAASPRAELDVQLVLDTTGSMGDELAYLQSEFDAIAGKVKARFPNVTPRWSLVVYRDKGDDYVTRNFDFTSDTAKFRRDLRAQAAGGGGDTPEAVVEGLGAGVRQGWRSGGSVAKLAFWVADAPAHPGEGRALARVVRDAQQKGIHVYPIASSDTDPAAEYQMRSTAQMTGGRYLFLTNDSGIGNDHAEPHIPCYSVTRLDGAIVRMIESEMTGRHIAAESTDVLRSVGKPNADGKCQLASGLLVASY